MAHRCQQIQSSSVQVLVEQLRQKCLEEKVDKNGEISKAYSALTQAPQEWAVEVSNCAIAKHVTRCGELVGQHWARWAVNIRASTVHWRSVRQLSDFDFGIMGPPRESTGDFCVWDLTHSPLEASVAQWRELE